MNIGLIRSGPRSFTWNPSPIRNPSILVLAPSSAAACKGKHGSSCLRHRSSQPRDLRYFMTSTFPDDAAKSSAIAKVYELPKALPLRSTIRFTSLRLPVLNAFTYFGLFSSQLAAHPGTGGGTRTANRNATLHSFHVLGLQEVIPDCIC